MSPVARDAARARGRRSRRRRASGGSADGADRSARSGERRCAGAEDEQWPARRADRRGWRLTRRGGLRRDRQLRGRRVAHHDGEVGQATGHVREPERTEGGVARGSWRRRARVEVDDDVVIAARSDDVARRGGVVVVAPGGVGVIVVVGRALEVDDRPVDVGVIVVVADQVEAGHRDPRQQPQAHQLHGERATTARRASGGPHRIGTSLPAVQIGHDVVDDRAGPAPRARPAAVRRPWSRSPGRSGTGARRGSPRTRCGR